MEENYFLAINCVLERFDKSDNLFYFYVCALYGLLCKYSNYKDVVLKIFRESHLYIDNCSISEILKKHNIAPSEGDDDYTEDSETNVTYGISSPGHEFYLDDNDVVKYSFGEPFIACSMCDTPIEMLLNTFCHEMGHLIKGAINGFDVIEDEEKIEYYIRTGFAYCYYLYDKENDELSTSISYGILDEAINTIETTEVMREILSLSDISIDDELSKFVNSLDKDLLLKDRGYDVIIEIVRRLWNIESFRDIVCRDIVENGIEELEGLFDGLVGDEKLFELNELLETIFNSVDSDDQELDVDDLKDKVLGLISIFDKGLKRKVK